MKAAVIAGVVVLATASGFAMAQVSDQSSAPIVLAQVANPEQGPSTTVSADGDPAPMNDHRDQDRPFSADSSRKVPGRSAASLR